MSASGSVNGLHLIWGWLVFLVAIGGLAFSFFDPANFLKDNAKLAMAAAGGLVTLLALIAVFTAASYFGGSMQEGNAYAHASREAGASVGPYLAVVVGIGVGVLGFLIEWGSVPSVLKK